MGSNQVGELREKVDAFLKDALTESNPARRAKLLGKAVYWNDMMGKVEAPQRGRSVTAHPTEHRIT